MPDSTQQTSTSLYNKYRPHRFEDVIGQSIPVKTLENTISNGKVANAYLLSGTRGVGKTTLARIFAKAIMCTSDDHGIDGCGECDSCRAFDDGSNPDFIELDAASNNGVDNIRSLIGSLSLSPRMSRRRVVLIDEAHNLTGGAATAMLKALEEPPAHVTFILATTDPMKLLETIRSRCMWIKLSPLPSQLISAHVTDIAAREGVTLTPQAADIVADVGRGGMRDALSTLGALIESGVRSDGDDSVIDEKAARAYFGTLPDETVAKLVEAVASRDGGQIIGFSVRNREIDQKELIIGFADVVSAAIILKATDGASSVSWLVKPGLMDSVRKLAAAGDMPWLVHARDVIERLAWRLDNKSLDKTSVFNDIMLMAAFPEFDPSCASFGVDNGVDLNGGIGTAETPQNASERLTSPQTAIRDDTITEIMSRLDMLDERTQGMSNAEKGIIELLKKIIARQ